MEQLSTPSNYRTRYCQRFQCEPERFVQGLFWKTLYPHARAVAWLMLLLRPKFFKNEFEAIRQIGLAKDLDEVRQEIDFLASLTRQEGSFLKKKVRLRVSGRRLLDLMAHL